MPRAVNKATALQKKKKYYKLAKGYWGARSKVWTIVKTHVEKGLQYAYRDRRNKKRTFRQLWIVRINAGARLNGTTYSLDARSEATQHSNQPQGPRRPGDEPA